VYCVFVLFFFFYLNLLKTHRFNLSAYVADISGLALGPYSKRGVPDVAHLADPETGVYIYGTFFNANSPSWYSIGGTSLSSQLWAATWSIVTENVGFAFAGI
jgi:hypothetical protein